MAVLAANRVRSPENGQVHVFEEIEMLGARFDSGNSAQCSVCGLFRLALSGDRVFVTSQKSSSVWIENLKKREWAFEDEGTICEFPTKDYCNVEGIGELPAEN